MAAKMRVLGPILSSSHISGLHHSYKQTLSLSYGSKLVGKTSPECPEHSPKLGAQLPVTISVALESVLGSLRE